MSFQDRLNRSSQWHHHYLLRLLLFAISIPLSSTYHNFESHERYNIVININNVDDPSTSPLAPRRKLQRGGAVKEQFQHPMQQKRQLHSKSAKHGKGKSGKSGELKSKSEKGKAGKSEMLLKSGKSKKGKSSKKSDKGKAGKGEMMLKSGKSKKGKSTKSTNSSKSHKSGKSEGSKKIYEGEMPSSYADDDMNGLINEKDDELLAKTVQQEIDGSGVTENIISETQSELSAAIPYSESKSIHEESLNAENTNDGSIMYEVENFPSKDAIAKAEASSYRIFHGVDGDNSLELENSVAPEGEEIGGSTSLNMDAIERIEDSEVVEKLAEDEADVEDSEEAVE